MTVPVQKSMLLFFLFIFAFQHQLFSQEEKAADSQRDDAPKVFIDCQFCDIDYMRQQIQYLNYVRDRKLADVHVLVTQQRTGSGGREYSFVFIGQQQFKGMTDTLTFNTAPDGTSDENRQGRAKTLELGLIRYLAKTPLAQNLLIDYSKKMEPVAVEDKWKNWVFNTNVNGWFAGEASYNTTNIYTNLSIDKVTPDLRIEFFLNSNYNESNFKVGEDWVKSLTRSQYASASVIKSLNEHWSVGIFNSASSSIYNNYNFNGSTFPGLEYNIFPYSESTRKQFRITYKAGYTWNKYNETTLYGKDEESLLSEELSFILEVRQKWGSVRAGIQGSHYFHDFSLNRLSVWSSLNFRLFKGFSVRLSGEIAFIHNQISLSAGGNSEEDILLRQRQLATSKRYNGNIGISYTFGSIYNNVVNPRFGR